MESLHEKIHGTYDSLRYVPHAEFLLRLRRDWEPNLPEAARPKEVAAQPYSILSIHLGALRRAEAERIVSEYFAGIKRIVFLGDRAVYERLAAAFNAGFKRRNIEPSVNGLQIVYDSHGKDVARGCPWGVCAADSFCPSSLVRGAAAGVDLSFESQCRCHEEAASFACLKATMSIYLGQRKGWRSREYSCPVEWQVMEDHWVVKFEFVRSMQENEGVL